jgi:SAM-dependent methyltransferase
MLQLDEPRLAAPETDVPSRELPDAMAGPLARIAERLTPAERAALAALLAGEAPAVRKRRRRHPVRAAVRALLRASTRGLAKGPHITRYAMYRRLARYRHPSPGEATALSISDSLPLCQVLGFAADRIVNVTYPEVSILALPFPDGAFDCVVSDQVLEHVQGDPRLAVGESLRVLRPGGLAVHTTCLLNPIHNVPGDYWRFTPAGLALLVGERAEVVEAAGWGNPLVWLYAWFGMRYEPVPHARWHPCHRLATWNLEEWPISTWVVAKKRP